MAVRQVAFTAVDRVEVTDSTISTELGPHDVLIATSHAGICGSDVAALTGNHPWFRPPLVTGHEITAHVVEVGSDVSAFTKFDPVLLNPLLGCGECLRCQQAKPNQCLNAAVRGFRLPGAAVTHLVCNEAELHTLPANLDPATAVLAEPLACAWRAAHQWDDLKRVAVIGAGTIGQLVLACLRYRRAEEILVVEPNAAKRQLAASLGASQTLHPDQWEAGPGLTGVFDCVSSQQTLEQAASACLGGAAIIAVGVPATTRTIPLPRMQRYEIALLGSGLYTAQDMNSAISAIANKEIDPTTLISGVYPLNDSASAFAHAREDDAVKVLIQMG